MKEWNRTTRELAFEYIPIEVRTELQKHTEQFNLGNILNEHQLCIETLSEKVKKGLFGGGNKNRQAAYAILTPRWLVWAVIAEGKIMPISAQLHDIVIEDYRNNPGYKLIQDSGIFITGALTGQTNAFGAQSASIFFGMGEEPAAEKFKDLLIRAVQEAKK